MPFLSCSFEILAGFSVPKHSDTIFRSWTWCRSMGNDHQAGEVLEFMSSEGYEVSGTGQGGLLPVRAMQTDDLGWDYCHRAKLWSDSVSVRR